MENSNNILDNNDLIILNKIESIAKKDNDLLFYKNLVHNKIADTSFSIPKKTVDLSKYLMGSLTTLSIIAATILLYVYADDHNNSNAKNHLLAKDSVNSNNANSTEESLAQNQNIKNEPKPIIFDESSQKITPKSFEGNDELEKKLGKAMETDSKYGNFILGSRETVVTSAVPLKNNINYDDLKRKIIEHFSATGLNLADNKGNIINLGTPRLAGVLNNGKIVLFSFSFKVFQENNTKLQITFRYHDIVNKEEAKNANEIEAEKIFNTKIIEELPDKIDIFMK